MATEHAFDRLSKMLAQPRPRKDLLKVAAAAALALFFGGAVETAEAETCCCKCVGNRGGHCEGDLSAVGCAAACEAKGKEVAVCASNYSCVASSQPNGGNVCKRNTSITNAGINFAPFPTIAQFAFPHIGEAGEGCCVCSPREGGCSRAPSYEDCRRQCNYHPSAVWSPGEICGPWGTCESLPRPSDFERSLSDRNLKEHVHAVNTQTVLTKVAELPLATWNYIAEDPAVRHMGPMAQDFAAAFGLGADDRHIHVIDASGVALAAIQALYSLAQEQERQLDLLRAELDGLRREAVELGAAGSH